jgi:hypothetical protein
MKKSLIVTGFLIILSLSVFSEEEHPINLKFSALSLSDSLGNVIYKVGEEVFNINGIPNGARSPEYSYNGPIELTFYKHGTVYEKIGTVKLSPTFKKVLLLFVANTNSGSIPYSIYPMDESDLKYTPNSYYFINITNYDIRGLLNDSKFEIKSFNRKVVPVTGSPEDNEISMVFSHKEEWKPLYRSKWANKADLRTMVMLIPRSPGSKKVTIRQFVDSKPQSIEVPRNSVE